MMAWILEGISERMEDMCFSFFNLRTNSKTNWKSAATMIMICKDVMFRKCRCFPEMSTLENSFSKVANFSSKLKVFTVLQNKDSEDNDLVTEDLSFEKAISELEELVHRMESGDAPLDSLVSHYQKGMNLLKHCREKIKSAELKIKEVSTQDPPETDS